MTVSQTLSTDTALQILANQQRRRLLHHLVDADGPVPMDKLYATVFTNTSSSEEPTEFRDRFKIQLHHVHLPKLQEADLIEYDRASSTVQYQSDDKIEEFLEVCS